MGNTALYQMFGITYVADGAAGNNVQSLTGQDSTLFESASLFYPLGNSYPDQYVDDFTANGADLLLKCQNDKGRASAYAGPDGTYRAVHASFFFGALRGRDPSHTQDEVMDAYMRYLLGDSLVAGITDEVSVSEDSVVNLMVEADATQAGKDYLILGTLSGTSPGIPVGSVTLPVNWDGFTDFVLGNINGAVFQNFWGTLDAEGRAVASINVTMPLNPSKIGQVMHFAYLTAYPMDFASNAASVEFIP